MKSYVRISIVLSKNLADWIKQQAEFENRSVNNYIETILLRHFNQEKGKLVVECSSVQ